MKHGADEGGAVTLETIMAAKRLVNSFGPPAPKLLIVENPLLCDRIQVKFPRSNKQRIRKKWAKRASNWKSVPKRDVYKIGGMLVCHPITATAIRAKILKGESLL